MSLTVKRYGDITEITEVEKDPPKVRVYTPRERRTVHGPRRFDNIRRTKQICVRRVFAAIKAFGSPLLVTLTFNGDASDASYANDALRDFQVRLRGTFPEAQSLFVPEVSGGGRIHFHGLLFNVPLRLGDTRKSRRIIYGEERKTRILASIWDEGYVDAKQTDGSPRLANYVSKYITKGGGEILFNAMRILRISHGFPKEKTYKGVEAEKIAQEYVNRKPYTSWEKNNIFLGKISKKKYFE